MSWWKNKEKKEEHKINRSVGLAVKLYIYHKVLLPGRHLFN